MPWLPRGCARFPTLTRPSIRRLKIIGREDSKLDVIREMDRPH